MGFYLACGWSRQCYKIIQLLNEDIEHHINLQSGIQNSVACVLQDDLLKQKLVATVLMKDASSLPHGSNRLDPDSVIYIDKLLASWQQVVQCHVCEARSRASNSAREDIRRGMICWSMLEKITVKRKIERRAF